MAEVIHIHAGNSHEQELTITQSDGSALDLTGASGLTFLAKSRIDDADGSAVITATPVVTDAANGIITLTLAPSDSSSVDPGTYVWGVQFTLSGDLWEFPEPSDDPGKLIVKRGVVAATS